MLVLQVSSIVRDEQTVAVFTESQKVLSGCCANHIELCNHGNEGLMYNLIKVVKVTTSSKVVTYCVSDIHMFDEFVFIHFV